MKGSVIDKLRRFYQGGKITTLKQLSAFRLDFTFVSEVQTRLLMYGRPRKRLAVAFLLNNANVARCSEEDFLRLRPDVERFMETFKPK